MYCSPVCILQDFEWKNIKFCPKWNIYKHDNKMLWLIHQVYYLNFWCSGWFSDNLGKFLEKLFPPKTFYCHVYKTFTQNRNISWMPLSSPFLRASILRVSIVVAYFVQLSETIGILYLKSSEKKQSCFVFTCSATYFPCSSSLLL